MRPAGGESLEQLETIDAANIAAHAPAAADVEAVRRFFAERGFEAGPLVGVAFSIASNRDLMERWFPDAGRLEGTGEELSVEKLPRQVRDRIATVTTEAPPELHV
jgi:hypothetical protein